MRFKSTIVIFLLLVIAACKKDSTLTAPQPGQSPGTASYIKAGNVYATNEYFAILSNGQMSISILTAEGSEVSLRTNGTGVGTYELFKTSPNLAIYRELTLAGNFTEYNSNMLEQSYITGAINLTAVNGQTRSASGSFFFTGFASNGADVNINNGYFTEISFNDTLNATQLDNVLTANNDTVPLNFRLVTGFVYGDTIIEVKAQSNFNNPGQVLTIRMPYSITPGNYPFGLTGNYIGTYRQFGSPVTVSETGQLTLLFHSITQQRLLANFAFITKGPPSFNINTGTMIINYQKVK